MPVLKHARKKLRQDVKRERENKHVKVMFKKLLKNAKANPTAASVSEAFRAVDKAAKKNVIHKNKAARLKSSLSKATGSASSGQAAGKVSASAKKTTAKPAAKKKSPAKKAAK